MLKMLAMLHALETCRWMGAQDTFELARAGNLPPPAFCTEPVQLGLAEAADNLDTQCCLGEAIPDSYHATCLKSLGDGAEAYTLGYLSFRRCIGADHTAEMPSCQAAQDGLYSALMKLGVGVRDMFDKETRVDEETARTMALLDAVRTKEATDVYTKHYMGALCLLVMEPCTRFLITRFPFPLIERYLESPMFRPTVAPTPWTGCNYENDGSCDVPMLCPLGTDTNDCKFTSLPVRRKSDTKKAVCSQTTCAGGVDKDGYDTKPNVHRADDNEYPFDCGWTGQACVCYCWVKQ